MTQREKIDKAMWFESEKDESKIMLTNQNMTKDYKFVGPSTSHSNSEHATPPERGNGRIRRSHHHDYARPTCCITYTCNEKANKHNKEQKRRSIHQKKKRQKQKQCKPNKQKQTSYKRPSLTRTLCVFANKDLRNERSVDFPHRVWSLWNFGTRFHHLPESYLFVKKSLWSI